MSRRALLVGVQRSDAAQLRGPENDVDAMQAVLATERFGFETTVLHDPNKKRADIESALKALVEDTGAGDSLLFYYSGHGTHVLVSHGAEAECEAIVPSDYDDGRDDLAIKEFELHEWLRPAIGRGAKVTAILDCCFSGGMPPVDVLRRVIQLGGAPVRDALEAVPGELVEDLGLVGIRAIPRRRAVAKPSTFTRTDSPRDENALVVFGACNAVELATERDFDSVYMGVFTHYLVRVMQDLSSGATNLDVRDAVRRLIVSTTTEQTPIAYPTEPDAPFLV